uniref:Protein M01A8.2, isoform a n=1 Tax=Haemonchus contortus TaxID=6289 RepID=W6NED9_HAECO
MVTALDLSPKRNVSCQVTFLLAYLSSKAYRTGSPAVPCQAKRKPVVKTSTPHVKNGEKTIETPNISRIDETPSKASSVKAKTQFPTSSFAGGKPMTTKTRSAVSGHLPKAQSTSTAEISKEEKLRRLRHVARACDALCVVISRAEEDNARMRCQLEEANEKIGKWYFEE